MKNKLLLKAIAITILFLAARNNFAQTGDKNFIDQPYIEVTGTAEMEITPDLIYLDIQISENDSRTRENLPATEGKMKTRLMELGVDVAKDLMVKDLSSNYKDYWLGKTDVVISKDYQLIVHDAALLQKILPALKDLGISNIGISRFDHSKIEQFRKEIKINAIKAAKSKAEFLTAAIDQSIGKALFVQEINYGSYLSHLSSANANIQFSMKESNEYDSNTPELSLNKIRLEYSVMVRFELK
ncbi:MAG: SIMPL domain-containing protein [Bacteroidales bacterium]|nr:SIMPL domain-containing protein [Bacteroidales bacterium]